MFSIGRGGSETSQFRFGRSARRKEPIITTDKFSFVKDQEFPNGRVRWKCSHLSSKCLANIYTIDTNVVLFYDEHNHG